MISPKQLKFLVIGAGQRGHCYAEPIKETTTAKIHAVAEPVPFRRQVFGETYIWNVNEGPTEGQEFSDWKAWLTWETDRRHRQALGESVPEGVDGVFVCTLDETHVEIMRALAPMQLHIMCEKPLATSLADCLSIYRAFAPSAAGQDRDHDQTKIFSIGHVLRYSPHNLLLRKLLLTDRVIGDILSIEHVEPVGWEHFPHSFVRGHWRRQTPNGDGSLLTKCSHDIDFLLWMLSSPPSDDISRQSSHLPRSVSSMGSRNQFRLSRKPLTAGTATNCISCPMERNCQYSAVQIYEDNRLAKGDYHWLDHIVYDIEDVIRVSGVDAGRKKLLDKLSEDYDRSTTPDAIIASRPWYGRCVYESDNTVCDDQYVTITWDEDTSSNPPRPGKTAVLHMIANTEKECERRGRVYGSCGELTYDSHMIKYFDFLTQTTSVVDVPRQPIDEKRSHGGGDYGLVRAFVTAVDAVENHGCQTLDAQLRYVGCTLEDIIRGHFLVFAAEEARREEKVIQWLSWWEKTLST
ncbi:hypothetical protein EYZ11_004287 [Aspergillus tanneri]|uniref:Gfo/Idh/MocA-like oxidoreductase N-terminal domain-containing protein n=1 Tax=Aspergillus tanneri TaxID=1220188 RepID=A0A4S3JKU0_9EURO|nr:uncharacterized protein ATNIH1004_003696 [Aspergillus tanneri]KAA8651005.1 hypothetical protein ATNIH1004_003696 [Aspergillus tanneri]THC96209.1 hypothetical protein EYZ11_004287 [Aspergillus tanneri]